MSFGGKAVLIKPVLYAIPMHILAATNPPKTTLQIIEKQFSNFFWGNSEGDNKHHWFSWASLYWDKNEGGAGFRSIHDINKSLASKA